MPRPAVSVVMPFAGERSEAERAAAALQRLATGPDDELLLVDNAGTAKSADGVRIVLAPGEHSPAHARNVGARVARGEWILFLDADCAPPSSLIEAYFSQPIADAVGAVAGEVVGIADPPSLAARYGATRGFLSQREHLAHPYLPRAVAANLLVRRVAFEQLGGFYEGLRAAEDTDFTWRLQQAGWRLELRGQASVEHRHRASLKELRRQWRGYAAGRAWLARRYDGFTPELPTSRALARVRGRLRRPSQNPPADPRTRLERGGYAAIDALLGFEELAGLALSNRPKRPRGDQDAHVVLVAERFPISGDPRVELAKTLERARVEAAGRPAVLPADRDAPKIDYREDDGLAERLGALLWLLVRHPLRSLRDRRLRGGGGPSLTALAPAARRLERDPAARVQPLGGGEAPAVARRLQALVGRT